MPRSSQRPRIRAGAHKELARYWLRRAENLAKQPRVERGGFHMFRRLWASERRHLPAQDVAAAGGWRSIEVMRSTYQQADAETIQYVVEMRLPNQRRMCTLTEYNSDEAADFYLGSRRLFGVLLPGLVCLGHVWEQLTNCHSTNLRSIYPTSDCSPPDTLRTQVHRNQLCSNDF
jgi:hypothetical protein